MTAYWINPYGQIINIGADKHIGQVVKNPEKFGVTREYLESVFEKHGEPWGSEGNAREEIIKHIMEKGFIRIRLYRNFWSVQTWDFNSRTRKALEKWAEEAMNDKHAGPYMPVKLVSFGGQWQKSDLDISDVYYGKLSESVVEKFDFDDYEPCFVDDINEFKNVKVTFREILESCQKTP